MDAFLRNWITHARPPATVDVFEKIRLDSSVGELERLSRSEVMNLYAQSLKGHKTVRKSSEIRTFFAALKEIGLGECDGEQEKRLGDAFAELQQIRNIMVHKSGIVDARMIKACPWLKARSDIEIGKLYPLDIEVMQNHGKHVFELIDHILDRLERYASNG
jgi:hypothetical protein